MTDTPSLPNKFKVLELKPDAGLAVLQLDEDRMFAVPIKEGLEVKKGDTVALDKVDLDKEGVPQGATAARTLAS